MDIRITNTCNNNCLYCLEQAYREKEKFREKEEIFHEIEKNNSRDLLNFYGGNPLLHPNFGEIIYEAKKLGYDHIGVLTNTFTENISNWSLWKQKGLSHVGFYFHSFDSDVHSTIVNGGISLEELIKNLEILKKYGFTLKAIFHVNKQNISHLYKDILFLHKKYGIKTFEFVNYFPFDRPYDMYKNLLSYDVLTYFGEITKLFLVLKKIGVGVRFVKFSREFFGKFEEFYDFQTGILDQIGEEDRERLRAENPFCFTQKRCRACFIKDNCIKYANI